MNLEPNTLIQFLLDNKLAHTHFDKFLQEQMIEITDLGIEINTVLNKLRTTSKESEYTNEFAGMKLVESEQDER